MLIFIFTFTIIGMDWFAYRVKFNSKMEFDMENGMAEPNGNLFL